MFKEGFPFGSAVTLAILLLRLLSSQAVQKTGVEASRSPVSGIPASLLPSPPSPPCLWSCQELISSLGEAGQALWGLSLAHLCAQAQADTSTHPQISLTETQNLKTLAYTHGAPKHLSQITSRTHKLSPRLSE